MKTSSEQILHCGYTRLVDFNDKYNRRSGRTTNMVRNAIDSILTDQHIEMYFRTSAETTSYVLTITDELKYLKNVKNINVKLNNSGLVYINYVKDDVNCSFNIKTKLSFRLENLRGKDVTIFIDHSLALSN